LIVHEIHSAPIIPTVIKHIERKQYPMLLTGSPNTNTPHTNDTKTAIDRSPHTHSEIEHEIASHS